jgi:flagellin-specific chaperone FliS
LTLVFHDVPALAGLERFQIMSPTPADVARHYAQFQVQTASHPKRICMLHSRCVEFIIMAMNDSDRVRRRNTLDRAQKIISRLMTALPTGDNVSKSLYYLSDDCYFLLGRGKTEDCNNANMILAPLRNTFEQLLRTV